MGRHFNLAHRWGCVLLLDEADVFLAKRNVSLEYDLTLTLLVDLTNYLTTCVLHKRKRTSSAMAWYHVRTNAAQVLS